MKKLLLLFSCFAAISMSAATVTIDATNIKLNEELAGFPLYILRMEASSTTAAIRIQVNVTAEDYTDTYSIGGDNSALVLPAGAAASQASQATSGTMTIARPNGKLTVTGSIVCTNGTTYNLNLRYETPASTRQETLTLNTLYLSCARDKKDEPMAGDATNADFEAYAGYLDANSELKSPVWYIMAGTVVIDAQGRIEVTAINSAERTIHCILRGKPQGLEMTNDQSPMTVKIFRNGRVYIQRGEQLYDMTGVKTTTL